MNDFARKQLEKYGWKDGHDNSNILTSRWWCDVFNKAAQQISVVNTKTGVSVSSSKKTEEAALITPDRISKQFVKWKVSESKAEKNSKTR
ncbi:unnamed protein product [Larinioides sclopetarius]|uniref:Uncharacterized protein n=1 Tax=Larinioides sclopetarius TaxID=280406 RepID=A0AAV1Z4R9_9ARAC